MTEYRFHWWQADADAAASSKSSVTLEAGSPIQGAALALRHFRELGCDLAAPLAHLDISEADGGKRTLLVEEILDRLDDPHR